MAKISSWEDLKVFLICLGIGLVISPLSYFLFSSEKQSERRKKKNQKYCSGKSNYTFYDSHKLKKLSSALSCSHALYLNQGYNQRFENVIEIEENDFTLYIGDFFYQKDVEKNTLDKGFEILAKMSPKYRYQSDSNKYDPANWPSNVPIPYHIGPDYFNYYYFQKFCIIKPKFKVFYPNFMLRTKRLGLEKFENTFKLDGHPIFNMRNMISSSNPDDVKLFFDKDRISAINNSIDRSYIYETVDGLFIIKSEATILDTVERLHKNALRFFTTVLCDSQSLKEKYITNGLYLSSTRLFRFSKIAALLLFILFMWFAIENGKLKQAQEEIFGISLESRIESLTGGSKEVYVPELMNGYTWKNTKQIRLVDAMIFDYDQITQEKRERFFQPRFEKVKPDNIDSYATELAPKIKAKLGYIPTYNTRNFEDAMSSIYKCDSNLIVDTAALWLFVSRYYAQADDLETAVLLAYGGIISAYESENKTSNSMTIYNRIMHLDAMNICAYHLLYLAVKYNPEPELLKSVAKDMLKIAKNQHPCSSYIAYNKQVFIEVFQKEKDKNNIFMDKIFKYNLVEKYTKSFMDDCMPFIDGIYAVVKDDYYNWVPYIKTQGSFDEYKTTEAFKEYVGITKLNDRFGTAGFKKFVAEYLTSLEGIAIGLLCKAYQEENGELPGTLNELEIWSEETFPIDRFCNQPYEYNKNSDKILFSVGPDLRPYTKNDMRFW